jgi:hypothetical protein
MAQTPNSVETSRYVVLVVAVVCYLAAAVAYVSTSGHYPITVAVLSGVGTVFLALFMFGPVWACDGIARFLADLGNLLWWV